MQLETTRETQTYAEQDIKLLQVKWTSNFWRPLTFPLQIVNNIDEDNYQRYLQESNTLGPASIVYSNKSNLSGTFFVRNKRVKNKTLRAFVLNVEWASFVFFLLSICIVYTHLVH